MTYKYWTLLISQVHCIDPGLELWQWKLEDKFKEYGGVIKGEGEERKRKESDVKCIPAFASGPGRR